MAPVPPAITTLAITVDSSSHLSHLLTMNKLLVVITLAVLGACQGQPQQYLPPSASTTNVRLDQFPEPDPLQTLAASIPGGGAPGQDFPILRSVPFTGFSCDQQEYPGYFADTTDGVGCQVFHICQADGRHDSFLCPNGTLFNQQYFVCDWWFNVDCAASQQFLSLNAEIGRIVEDTAASSFRSDASVDFSQSYVVPDVRTSPPAPAPLQFYSAPNGF